MKIRIRLSVYRDSQCASAFVAECGEQRHPSASYSVGADMSHYWIKVNVPHATDAPTIPAPIVKES